ncbi:Rho GTPase-activating protein domain [Trinorchestia longiramus]|nr:Rho GTPase-activating protein domain [Trinorchestia longiramus]
MACINRSLEDVESLMEFAKVDKTNLFSVSQTIEFPPEYSPDDFLLMQLPERLIDSVKEGYELVLRGEAEDHAVLCTDRETFEVREAETSNSLVLVPSLLVPQDFQEESESRQILYKKVVGVHYKYLEVRPSIPRLRRLRDLLSESPYAGPSDVPPAGEEQKVYDTASLLDRVQCSDEQLRTALEELPAVHIDGYWRMLDFEYHFGAVSGILGVVEQQQWPLDAVPRDFLRLHMKDVEPEPVVEMCLKYFFTPKPEDDNLLSINDHRISRMFAEVLLRPADRFSLNEFLDIWQQSVPPGVNTSIDQLEGVAVVDRIATPAVVWHFPEYQLPEDHSERFAALFEAKEKWTLSEITPYIVELSSSTCSVSSLLAKHSRAATHLGIKYYSAKHSSIVEDQLQLLRREDPTQYNTLVKMHLSFTTDLPTVCDTPDGQRPASSSGWRQLAPLARWLSGGKKTLPAEEAADLVHLSPELLQHFIVVIKFLASPEHVTTEGIFRKCGSSSRQLELRAELGKSFSTMTKDETDMPLLPVLSAYSTHDVASLLKSMLAELPEPLLLDHNFILHCKLADASDEDSSIGTPHYHRRIKALQLLLLLLPACNLQLLRALLLLLHNIASNHHLNRMSACNLGMVFAPHIMCPRKMSGSDLQTHSSVAGSAVSFMVRHAPKLFQVPVELECDVKQYWINRAEAAALHHSVCQEHHPSSLPDFCSEHDPTLTHTVFSFVDREQTEAASARETTALALAELYAHVSNLPDSDKKKRLVRQFNTASGCGTPKYQRSSRAKAFAHSIKKHLLRGASRRDPSTGSCDSSFRHRSWQHTDVGLTSSKNSGSYSPRQALEGSQMSYTRRTCTPTVTNLAMNAPHSIATTLTTPNLCCTPKPVHAQQARAKSWDNLTTPKNLRKCLFPSSPAPILKTNANMATGKSGKVEKVELASKNTGTPSSRKCDGKCFVPSKLKHSDAVRSFKRNSDYEQRDTMYMTGSNKICENNQVDSHATQDGVAADFTTEKRNTEITPARRLVIGYVNAGYDDHDRQRCSKSQTDDERIEISLKNPNASSGNITNHPLECGKISALKQDVGCSITTHDGIPTISCDCVDHATTISKLCSETSDESKSLKCKHLVSASNQLSCTISPVVSQNDAMTMSSDSVVVAAISVCPSASDGHPTTSSSVINLTPIVGSVAAAYTAGLEATSNNEDADSETVDNMAAHSVIASNDCGTTGGAETAAEGTELSETLPKIVDPDAAGNTSDSSSATLATFPASGSDSIFGCPVPPASSNGRGNLHAVANSPCSPLTNAMLSNDITQALVLTPRSRCPIVSSKNSRNSTSCSTLAALALHNCSARRCANLPTVVASPSGPDEVFTHVSAETTSNWEVSGESTGCANSQRKQSTNNCDSFENDQMRQNVGENDLRDSKMKNRSSDTCSETSDAVFQKKFASGNGAGRCVSIKARERSSLSSVPCSDKAAKQISADTFQPNLIKNCSAAAIFPKSTGMENSEIVSFKPNVDESPLKVHVLNAIACGDLSKKAECERRRGRSLVRRKSSLKQKFKSDSWKLDGCERKEPRQKMDNSKNVSKLGKSMRRSLSRRLSRGRQSSCNIGVCDEDDGERKNIPENSQSASPPVHERDRVKTLPASGSKRENSAPIVDDIPAGTDRYCKSPSVSPFSCSPGANSTDPRYSSSTSAALGQFFRHLSSSSLAQIAQRLKTNNDPSLVPSHKALTPIQSDTSNSSFVSVPSSPVAEMDESLSLVFREYLETRSILTSANSSQIDCQATSSPCNHRPTSCCDHHSFMDEEREGKCRSVPVLESDLLFASNTGTKPSIPYDDGSGDVRSQSCDAINILYSFTNSVESSIGLSLPPQHLRYSSVDSADPAFLNRAVSIGSESLPEFNEIAAQLNDESSSFSNFGSKFSDVQKTKLSNQESVILANEQLTPLDPNSDQSEDISNDTFHSTGGEFSNSLLQCLDGQNPLSVSYDSASGNSNCANINSTLISTPPKMRMSFTKSPAHSRLSYRSAVDLGSLLISDHLKILTPVCEQTSPPKSPNTDRGKENVEPLRSNDVSIDVRENASALRDRSPLTASNERQPPRKSPNNCDLQLVHHANQDSKIGDHGTTVLEECSISSNILESSLISHSLLCSTSTSELTSPMTSATKLPYDSPCADTSSVSNAPHGKEATISSQGSSKELASCSPSGRSFSVLGTKQGTPKRAPAASSAAAAVHFETKL